MRVGPGGARAEHRVRDGHRVAWIDGEPAGGPEALAATLFAGDAAHPGAWSAVVEGPEGPVAHAAPFGGSPLWTDGWEVASDPSAFDLRGRPVDVDAVRRHLAADPSGLTASFAAGVLRIPEGHRVRLDGRLRIERAWDPAPRGSPGTPEIRALVERAVRAVAESPARVALSGGLDSSLVALLLARWGEVRAVSNRFPGWPADEGPWLEAVGAAGRFARVDVDSRSLDPTEVLELLAPPRFPPVLPNHHLNLALLRAGGSPLVTGFGGDEVVGHGLTLPRELAAAGRPGRALWEAAWLALRFRHGERTRSPRFWAGYARNALRGRAGDPVAVRKADVTHPWVGRSRDEIAALADAIGARVRTPLLDPALAEAMLAVPTAARVRRGRTRVVLRDAFADLLPPEVARRSDKADLVRSFDEPFLDALPRHWPGMAPALEGLLTLAELASTRDAAESGDHGASAALWRALGAARWLSWHTGRHARRT